MMVLIKYNDETVNYSDLIKKQSEYLVKTLLGNEKFKGFYLALYEKCTSSITWVNKF